MEQATFAAGCFWGVEAAFRLHPGVLETSVGYTDGNTVNPTYPEVCTGNSGHAEAVQITFDLAQVSYTTIGYFLAEDYHQQYLEKRGQAHCH